jgi:hypothetical protein
MNIEAIIEENAHHFLQGVKTEYKGNKEAVVIIQKYIKEGKISDEEEHILKIQLADSLKIVGIGVPFVIIPGASILMPILIKVAGKHNIELMPSAFINPKKQGEK